MRRILPLLALAFLAAAPPRNDPNGVRAFVSVPAWYLDYEIVVDCQSDTDNLHAVITGHVDLGTRNTGGTLSSLMSLGQKPIDPKDYMSLAQKIVQGVEDGATWARTPLPGNPTEAETQAWLDSSRATLNATYTVDGAGRTVRARASGLYMPLGLCMMDVDVAKKVYALNLPVAFGETPANPQSIRGDERVFDGKTWVTRPFEMSWGVLTWEAVDPAPENTGNAFVLRGPLPDHLGPLSGNLLYRLRYNSNDQAAGKMQIRYTLALKPPTPASLTFHAVETGWRPTPGPDEDTPDPENPLHIRWKVHQQPGHEVEVEQVSFHLSDVSRYPGVCMNWPGKPSTISDGQGGLTCPLDLRFKQETGSDVDWFENGLLLRLTGARAKAGEGTEEIQCFDGAAIGELVAEAKLADGRVLLGEVPGKGNAAAQGKLMIPERPDGSDIAAAWKDQFASGKADKDDDDDAPKGDGQTGDGLTVWEEYRGFMVGGEWTDCKPKKKDLFVHNSAGPNAEPGMALFARATGLEVHGRLRREERRDDRVINFNLVPDKHAVDQHCLRLQKSPKPIGEAEQVKGARFPGPPRNTEHVYVVLGLTGGKFFPDPASPTGQSLQSDQDAMVAHELGHAIGIYHHGDRDIWEGGKFGVFWKRAPGGVPIVTEDFSGPIHPLYNPQLAPIPVDVLFPKGVTARRVGVGQHFGQHSGSVECFMRYNIAEVHPLIADPKGRVLTAENEPPGYALCTGAAGTRFNLPTEQPESWYSGADDMRGDCAHQFVISDAHEITYRDDQAQKAMRGSRRAP